MNTPQTPISQAGPQWQPLKYEYRRKDVNSSSHGASSWAAGLELVEAGPAMRCAGVGGRRVYLPMTTTGRHLKRVSLNPRRAD